MIDLVYVHPSWADLEAAICPAANAHRGGRIEAHVLEGVLAAALRAAGVKCLALHGCAQIGSPAVLCAGVVFVVEGHLTGRLPAQQLG